MLSHSWMSKAMNANCWSVKVTFIPHQCMYHHHMMDSTYHQGDGNLDIKEYKKDNNGSHCTISLNGLSGSRTNTYHVT